MARILVPHVVTHNNTSQERHSYAQDLYVRMTYIIVKVVSKGGTHLTHDPTVDLAATDTNLSFFLEAKRAAALFPDDVSLLPSKRHEKKFFLLLLHLTWY